MSLVQTPVLEIEVEQDGPHDGRPLLLLHGWPDAPREWRPVAERLHERSWRTIVPTLRGSGVTRFRSADAPRDGRGVALAADAIDLLDALGLDRVPIAGHDWGARAAYTIAAVAPERPLRLSRWHFRINRAAPCRSARRPCRAFWYQWLLYLDAAARAVAADPIVFARLQWDTWSPPGWFDDDDFEVTARSFTNPDWVAITLNA